MREGLNTLTGMTHDERMEAQTIDERDAAEKAMSDAYSLVMGSAPEWSNLFDYNDALEQIEWKLKRDRDALSFYAEYGAGCRLIHAGGDDSRHALAADGGEKAKLALAPKEGAGG